MNEKSFDLTIVVLLWNKYIEVTKPFLESFLKNEPQINYELILFDNGSNDETYEQVVADFETTKRSNWQVIRSRENLGFGAGNNEAAKEAHSDTLLFLNNDIVFEKGDWATRLLEKHKERPKRVTGAMLVSDNSATHFRGITVPYVNGWCLMIDKGIFNEIGGFDIECGKAYFEDVLLSREAVIRGYTLVECPDLGLIHLGSKSTPTSLISPMFKYAQRHFFNRMNIFELERTAGRKRIVFLVQVNYPFTDDNYEGEGVGGAEASIILLAREMARLGHRVEIYNNTDTEGKFGGVHYYNIKNFDHSLWCDHFILFREPHRVFQIVNAGVKVFWSCDQYTRGYWPAEVFPYMDKMICISHFHKKYILDNNIDIKPEDILVMDLGVNKSDYEEMGEKVPGRMIFCSVPERGLHHMAKLLPLIQERVPNATLDITSDYTLWGADPLNERFKALLENKQGVRYFGKVPRAKLVQLQREAMVMAYPGEYDENFCISAMECMAAGAVPVTTDVGAMSTTVGKGGIVIKHKPYQEEYSKIFVDFVVALLTNPTYYKAFKDMGHTRAINQYTWYHLAPKWLNEFAKIEEELKENKTTMARKKKLTAELDLAPTCKECRKTFDSTWNLRQHQKSHGGIDAYAEPVMLESSEENKNVMVHFVFAKKMWIAIAGRTLVNNSMEADVPAEFAGEVAEMARRANIQVLSQ